MSYQPKAKENEILDLAHKELERILGSVQSVVPMYIEPGDTLLVKVKDSVEDGEMTQLNRILAKLFTQNRALVARASDITNIEVVKAVENASKSCADCKCGKKK